MFHSIKRHLQASQNPWSRPPILVKMELIMELKELQRSPSSAATGVRRKSNSTALCPTVTRLKSMSAVGLSTCKTATRVCETDQRIRTDCLSTQLSQQSFASNQDTSTGDEVLKCPLCSYRCSVRNSMINHCYMKWVKARPIPKPPSHVDVVPVRTFNRQNFSECSAMTTTATSER